jgi:hypothetical protein
LYNALLVWLEWEKAVKAQEHKNLIAHYNISERHRHPFKAGQTGGGENHDFLLLFEFV